MRRLAMGAALLVLVAGMSGVANADAGYNPPVGDIYLSFDATALPPKVADAGDAARWKTVAPFTAFNFYLLLHIDWAQPPYNDAARNTSDGASAWEGSVNFPATVIITARQLPPGHSDFGSDSAGFDNWIVGTGGQCINAASTPFTLVSYSGLLSAAVNDVQLTVGPSSPSTFDDAGCSICIAQPGFLDCQTAGALYPSRQAAWRGHWITLNCTTGPCTGLPAETKSWGNLKSEFSE